MRWAAVVVVLVIAACARGLLTSFPHRLHLASIQCGGPGQPKCLSCPSCHQSAGEEHATWSPPTEARCTGCHDDSKKVFAHSVRPETAVLPDGKKIIFAHGPHLKMKEINGQCVGCHAGAVGVEGGPPLFPPMATCLECHHHQEQFAANACTSCHRQEEMVKLEPKSFLPHDSGWGRRHGLLARTSPDRCALCHAQQSCDVCHDTTRPLGPQTANPDALERNFVHRFDFLARHPIEAASQPGSCVTCHVKTECDACHITRGVSATGIPGTNGGASPHPLGWASGLGASTNLHGPAAKRDIGSCAACHDQGPATNCVRCHKVGALGGSPHPMGWRSTEPVTSTTCAVCHGGTP
ncbi:MAG: hypothetical protein U0228_19490 [Myxococcaceae bacterium]